MATPWERFMTVARGGQADQVPVALIVDSPWLPGYGGVDTMSYILRDDVWLRVNLGLRDRFPDVAWVPGFWVEYGMAAEPSAYGARVVWHNDSPPSILPLPGGLAALAAQSPADPEQHGMMPLVLSTYAAMEEKLKPEGLHVPMVAARGPLAVASWLVGVTDLMVALKLEPATCHQVLQMLTDTTIRFLRSQLAVLSRPEGILLLDDIVGMLSPKMFEQFARPYYSAIFNAFPGLVKIYHNDTPAPHLLGAIASLGCDVLNFSHTIDIADARTRAPGLVLMGNVPPLDLMVRGTPEAVEAWGRECIRKTGGRGLVLSAGGGVSMGTPEWAIDALVRAARTGPTEG